MHFEYLLFSQSKLVLFAPRGTEVSYRAMVAVQLHIMLLPTSSKTHMLFKFPVATSLTTFDPRSHFEFRLCKAATGYR